jgi:c-di-GMP-binding flagellar brake protein YcgR
MGPEKNNYTGAERRKFPRLYTWVKVKYKIIKKQSHPRRESKEEKSVSENLSIGGICIKVNEEIKKNTILALEVYLPEDNNPITAEGIVVWSNLVSELKDKELQWEIGIEFLEIKESDRKKLGQYIMDFLTY